jgi:hypothetical protein
MRARLASSCSRNGMRAVATETICFGETSISLDLGAGHRGDLGGRAEEDVPLELELELAERGRLGRAPHEHSGVAERPVGVEGSVRLGDDVLLLLVGGQVDDLVGDLAVDHRRYGDSMKPNSFTRAKVARAPMRPMFGPSGVSIGHMRP